MNKYNGPWEVIASSKPGNGTGWRDIVATTGPYAPTYVGEAFEDNARLIAAAPELLGLLVEAVRLADAGRVMPSDTLRAARAAIAKATNN